MGNFGGKWHRVLGLTGIPARTGGVRQGRVANVRCLDFVFGLAALGFQEVEGHHGDPARRRSPKEDEVQSGHVFRALQRAPSPRRRGACLRYQLMRANDSGSGSTPNLQDVDVVVIRRKIKAGPGAQRARHTVGHREWWDRRGDRWRGIKIEGGGGKGRMMIYPPSVGHVKKIEFLRERGSRRGTPVACKVHPAGGLSSRDVGVRVWVGRKRKGKGKHGRRPEGADGRERTSPENVNQCRRAASEEKSWEDSRGSMRKHRRQSQVRRRRNAAAGSIQPRVTGVVGD
ncbi:hypothetical protein DFH09DRAFT_1102483 [Mycena vulgaris]|nr:hypothetical protein DFH09DRAFT_1102483 [Mycena vulgaris]